MENEPLPVNSEVGEQSLPISLEEILKELEEEKEGLPLEPGTEIY